MGKRGIRLRWHKYLCIQPQTLRGLGIAAVIFCCSVKASITPSPESRPVPNPAQAERLNNRRTGVCGRRTTRLCPDVPPGYASSRWPRRYPDSPASDQTDRFPIAPDAVDTFRAPVALLQHTDDSSSIPALRNTDGSDSRVLYLENCQRPDSRRNGAFVISVVCGGDNPPIRGAVRRRGKAADPRPGLRDHVARAVNGCPRDVRHAIDHMQHAIHLLISRLLPREIRFDQRALRNQNRTAHDNLRAFVFRHRLQH